jgi:hypothetical protein
MRSEHTEKVQYVEEVALSGHPPIADFSFTKPLSMEFLGHHYEVTHWRDVLVRVAEVLSETHHRNSGGSLLNILDSSERQAAEVAQSESPAPASTST